MPISIIYDKDFMSSAFSRIYGGKIRSYKKTTPLRITLADIAKSEIHKLIQDEDCFRILNCGRFRPLHDLLSRQKDLHDSRLTASLSPDFGSPRRHSEDSNHHPLRLYEFSVMTFGFRNTSQTFQRYINTALRDLDFVFVYVDDILIASLPEEEHQKHLDIVLNSLNEYELQANLEKCSLGDSELVFLGHPEKVKAVQEFPKPQTIKELR
ncbi:hypothetical protein TSAR_004682 [Trichomalopsis sarcophagae]|uniref:Reverse transcriptase domain-containing protein n=1 Tax=Trichomalopsis sarcophagae TaxID=543379 RepID=A0A232EFM6_9HYME|nr:hypothetical protein TSAR_004682 [Trichomalopsis sarcophagae]